MAVISGTRGTYSDSVNEHIDISSALDLLHPSDTPLLLKIGKNSLRDGCTATKHEWLEDALRGQTSNDVGGTINNTTDPVTVTVTSGDGNTKFRVDDILKIEDELVRVTAVAANTVTVSRGWGGSTNAAHASGILITLLGSARPQGSAVGASRTTTKTNLFNYTQIFEESVVVTATNQATKKYVNGSGQGEVEYQIERTMEILGTNLEKTLMFGRKSQPTSATVPGTMDGILPRFTTNVYNKAAAALTQTMLEDAMQDIWVAGTKALVCLAGATQARRIDTFLDAYREAGYEDKTLGSFVQRYITRFGAVDLVMSRWMPNSEVWLLDTSKIGLGPLQGRALGISKLPPTSREFDTWQISGEYTTEVRMESSHARIYNLATTGLF